VTRRPGRPGRSAFDFRAVRHGEAKRAVLASLSARPELAGLTTRRDDDPVVALVDAWAGALGVLSFHSERIAQEGFLRTATERGSVLELARALGYELRPGVAAQTWLSFAMSAVPGVADELPVPVGTRVQSVPGPDELPQVFETVEPLSARPEWNAVPVRATASAPPSAGESVLLLLGADLVLTTGDVVLVVDGPHAWWDARRVLRTEPVPALRQGVHDVEPIIPAHTRVHLDGPLTARPLAAALAGGVPSTEVHVVRQRASLFGYNAQPWAALPVSLRVGEADPRPTTTTSTTARKAGRDVAVSRVAATAGSLIGGAYSGRASSWADAALPAGTTTVHLDQVHPKVVPGSWLVLERSGAAVLARVGAVADVPVADFGLAARATRVTLSGADAGGFSPRTTAVLAQSEPLPLAPRPLAGVLPAGAPLALLRPVPDPGVGRSVVVSGVDPEGRQVSEVAVVRAVGGGAAGVTSLTLHAPLTGRYAPASTRVLLNVVPATHGESRAELLGRGDPRRAFQSFRLRGGPLTHVVAATPDGSRSTLAVWVGGVRWHEVDTLHGQPPDARVCTTRRADDGTVTVGFGDGLTAGARLPAGRDVVATFRVGIGRAADLGVDRLTLPLSRPLGLESVTNPVPAAGADDPEPLARARLNAPRTVRTLGRVVSVDDYESFARSYAGVGLARADVLWDGERRVVHLTVTGPGGAPLATITRQALLEALDAARHATLPVRISPHHDVRFAVHGRLVVAPDRRPVDVVAAATRAVVERWSFDGQDLGRSVSSAQVVSLLQEVPGVVGVLLSGFTAVGDSAVPAVARVVPASPARRVGAQTLPADLLLVSADDVRLTGVPA
jgi:predicted phage baseplate assembly protein